MKITIDGIETLSQEYHSFEDLLDEYVDYETKRGRQVPDYDLSILLTAIGIYLLKKAVDELIRETRERRQERKDNEAARLRDEKEERRHAELLSKTDDLIRAIDDAEKLRSQDALLGEDAESVSAFLQWARRQDVQIVIHLDTEAENDLREALESLTIDMPGSIANETRPELEEDSA